MNFDKLFINSWWVIIFILGCLLSYERGLYKKDLEFAKLQAKYHELQNKKLTLKLKQENLQKQINCQSDPAWIELVLMKGLGVVPEGQTKVVFTRKDE